MTDGMPDPVDSARPQRHTSCDELERLRDALAATDDSTERLRLVFADLRARLGHAEASRLWLAAFADHDASET
jgi:hypothetical protein